MINLDLFFQVVLRGGFIILKVDLASETIVDGYGREVLAQTVIVGKNFHLLLRAGLSDVEFSVSLYHEILEAMAVASTHPPESVLDFIESDFENAGYEAHKKYGNASPENLNRMLQTYGFREE